MKLTELAIRKSMTTITMMFFLIVAGVISYLGLPRESSPDVKIPFVMVYAPYYGASPGDIENLVTRKIENQLKALPDLDTMSSTSSEGVCSILLEFTPDVEMTDALQKVRDGVELAKPDLPQDVRDDLLVYEISASDWPIMQVILSGSPDLAVLKDQGEKLQERLEQIRGVLAVDMTGGIEREIRVDVDPTRLQFYDLSMDDVLDAVSLENVTLPGGEIGLGTYEYQVRVPGEFTRVDTIGGIILNPAEDVPVYLGDVADVGFSVADRSTISRSGSTEAITLSVKKRSGENIIRIAEEVHATLAEAVPALGPNARVQIMVDESVIIRDMVTELENNILSGLVLVVLVLFLFLGFTNSLFVAVAIPLSMLISFIVLEAMGVTLNMVVLFSLILALGMLVDNAIVIVENVFRHRTQGMEAEDAANKGTSQVATAVIASTLTTLCAFGPLLFWPGLMGEFMKYLPLTLVVTLASSLLVALTFNPVLCAKFMKVPTSARATVGSRLIDAALKRYEPLLNWALGHRAAVIALAILAFVGSLVLFMNFSVGVELFPDVDPTYAFVQIEAPSGTRIELSDAYAGTVEQAMEDIPDLKASVTEVGAGGDSNFGGTQAAPPHLTRLSMEFVKHGDRTQSSSIGLDLLRSRLTTFTGAKLTIDKQEQGPPVGKPINVEIVGDDFAVLAELSERTVEQLGEIVGVVDIRSNFDEGRPEIQVIPDVDKASRLGLRTMDLARTIRTAIKGEDISEFRRGEDEYDIVVRYQSPSRASAEDLENFTVFYEGQSIPVSSFADIRFTTGYGAIQRINGRRVVTVSADVASGYNGNALLAEVQDRLNAFELPAGYRFDFTGESEDQEEAQAFLSRAFGVAIMLIAIVLITQFDSVVIPFVILASVILSLIGVFVGLVVMRMPFGIIMTGVGVISLAGIVVNNAIVLLDYTLKLRHRGMELREAVITAGRTRFRPVILTAVTTILGLIPLSTGLSINFGNLFRGDLAHAVIVGGESSQWWGPMGVAVIWGLAVATFLTLIVVPVLYFGLAQMQQRFGRRPAPVVATGGNGSVF